MKLVKDKIGFNNFKSFGERVQTFSKMPITLIYGANSMGKSSCLQFLLYMEYVKKTGDINLKSSNFAGDTLDLGGFSNFVHKRESERKIKYQQTFTKKEDIAKYLPPEYEYFIELGVIDWPDTLPTEEEVAKRISLYTRKDDDQVYFFKKFKSDTSLEDIEKALANKAVLTIFNKTYLAFNPRMSGVPNIEKIIKENKYIHDVSKGELYKIIERTDGEHLDVLDLCILRAITSNLLFLLPFSQILNQSNNELKEKSTLAHKLFNILPLFQYFQTIKSIQVLLECNYNIFKFENIKQKELLNHSITLLVNDEEVFVNKEAKSFVDELDKGFNKLNTNTDFFKIIKKFSTTLLTDTLKRDGVSLDIDISSNDTLLRHNLLQINGTVIETTQSYLQLFSEAFRRAFCGDYSERIQYLGPLRFFPERSALRNKVEPKSYKYKPLDLSEAMDFSKNRKWVMNYLSVKTKVIKSTKKLKLMFEKILPKTSNLVGNLKKSLGKFFKSIFNFLGANLRVVLVVLVALLSLSYYLRKNYPNMELVVWNESVNDMLRLPLLLISVIFILYLISFPGRTKVFTTIFKNVILVRFNFFNFFRKNENKISLNNAKNSQAMWTSFMYTPEAIEKLDKWLSDESKMKSNYHIKIDTIENHNWLRRLFRLKPKVTKSLSFIDKFNNIDVTPREMGLGISQVLPVLVSCNINKNTKIFIEQPELHLHPGAQCEIADEFIISKNQNKNEFVIESHSEHMLLRFMKRMRQTADGTLKKDDPLALTPDDICLLYVDNNGEFTYLNELELDEEGNLLDPWPHGFFEEGYKERFD